jgi:isoleucyl-tRNA synthetase
MEDVILEEINVKAIEYVGDESGIVRKKAKANFKSIGPKFGKSVQQVAQRIRELGEGEIARLEKEGTLSLGVNGSTVTIARDDVEILREDIKGWLVESDGTLTVALDTEITAELAEEGTAREFVNRLQNMRKDAGFAVTDHITIAVRASEGLAATLIARHAYIAAETLADEISTLYRDGEYAAAFELNGEEITASIARRVRN